MFGPHQRFANQERVVPSTAQTCHVCAGLDSTLSHPNAFGWNFLSQSVGRCEIDMEGLEVATVDADHVASGIERPLQLHFPMDLAQHVKVMPLSGACKRAQVLLFESS